jgi:hypothetical protein
VVAAPGGRHHQGCGAQGQPRDRTRGGFYKKLDLRSRADLMALLARHGFETARTRK